jgi:spore coat protein A, manganese oxidase
MLTRRQFFNFAAVAGTSLSLPWRVGVDPVFTRDALHAGSLAKFVDALPIPDLLRGSSIQLTMTEFKQQLHRDLPPTTVWGYNGSYPGPVIEAVSGMPLSVTWTNDLPARHLLDVDERLDGMQGVPEVRTVTHLHGGHVPPECDGHPERWYGPGSSITCCYPNAQPSATLWYHDNAMGIARLNVAAGLAGLYLVRGPREAALNLPSGPYEIPLVIQDRKFDSDGRLMYPCPWESEFYGDAIVVNGKVWPYLEVEPRNYRLRLLNASNARFFELSLSSGQPFHQIGTDGGLLPRPVQVTSLLLAPGERADVIVDFAGKNGQTILLTNQAAAPFPLGGAPDEHTSQVMQIRVSLPLAGRDTKHVPNGLPEELRDTVLQKIQGAPPAKVRDVSLVESLDSRTGTTSLLGEGMQAMFWSDPVTETPRRNTIEVWNLINTTMDAHPVHLHTAHCMVLDRRPFDVEEYLLSGHIVYTGPVVTAAANERGLKDTVRANPGEVTRVMVYFADYTGEYVWQSQILDHADNAMMRPFEVIP